MVGVGRKSLPNVAREIKKKKTTIPKILCRKPTSLDPFWFWKLDFQTSFSSSLQINTFLGASHWGKHPSRSFFFIFWRLIHNKVLSRDGNRAGCIRAIDTFYPPCALVGIHKAYTRGFYFNIGKYMDIYLKRLKIF